LDFTLSAIVIMKIDGRQISGSSMARFEFYIINHYHNQSLQVSNLKTLGGQGWISHHQALLQWKLAGAKS